MSCQDGTGSELEQRPVAAWVAVGELRRLLVPGDLEQFLLDAVVEPRAAEHELAQPVDERLATSEGDVLPVADEIVPQAAARLGDSPVGGELDQVGGLVVVEVVVADQPERHGRRGHSFLEVDGVEGEPVAEELDDVLVPGGVVRLAHGQRIT